MGTSTYEYLNNKHFRIADSAGLLYFIHVYIDINYKLNALMIWLIDDLNNGHVCYSDPAFNYLLKLNLIKFGFHSDFAHL